MVQYCICIDFHSSVSVQNWNTIMNNIMEKKQSLCDVGETVIRRLQVRSATLLLFKSKKKSSDGGCCESSMPWASFVGETEYSCRKVGVFWLSAERANQTLMPDAPMSKGASCVGRLQWVFFIALKKTRWILDPALSVSEWSILNFFYKCGLHLLCEWTSTRRFFFFKSRLMDIVPSWTHWEKLDSTVSYISPQCCLCEHLSLSERVSILCSLLGI